MIDRINSKIGINEAQHIIDEKYGNGEWEVILYNGGHKPCLTKHKCGIEKEVSRFSTFKLGKTKCECQRIEDFGRPKLDFEDLANKVAEEDPNYELVEILEGGHFLINHKCCDRKPARTNSNRFFKKKQRCQCMKPGRQPSKKTEDLNGTDNI